MEEIEMISNDRKEELKEEFAYYLEGNLEGFDWSEMDDFCEDFEVDDEEFAYLNSLKYRVTVEENNG